MTSSSTPPGVTFDTMLLATGKNTTGILVPPALIAELGAGERPAVVVDVNGYQYRNTVGVMSGKHMIGVSAAIRSASGLKGGDAIHVTLTVATEPRPVEIPPDLALAFKGSKQARSFFDTLSNSLQRYHIDNINNAKTDETRQRRIEKAIGLFLNSKQR